MSPYISPGIEGRVDVININRYIAKEFGTTTTDMKSPSRKRDIRDARNMASYLLYTCTDMTYKAIGEVYSRDHSTIIHSVRAVKTLITFDVQSNEFMKESIRDLDLKYSKMKVHSLTNLL